MLNLVIKWQDTSITAPNWFDFPASDILHMPVSHAVNLFSNGIPVIIKQGERYVVNTVELFNSYRKNGKRVMMLDKVSGLDRRLSEGGFSP